MSLSIGQASRPTVLVLDDDATMRELLRIVLEEAECRPVLAESLPEALTLAGQLPVRAILTDVIGIAPNPRELAFMDTLHATWPGVPIILSTVSTRLRAISQQNPNVFALSPRPFDVKELIALVRRAVEASS